MSTATLLAAPTPQNRKPSFDIEDFVYSSMESMSDEQISAVAQAREEILAKARLKSKD